MLSNSVACLEEMWRTFIYFFLRLSQWWDVETGEALQTFYPTGSALKRIHVSSDFSTFVTIDSIGILYILRRVVWRRERRSETKQNKTFIIQTLDFVFWNLWTDASVVLYLKIYNRSVSKK